MPATVNGGGDQLARGAVRVNFRASDSGNADKWKMAFGEDSGPKLNVMSDEDRNRDSNSAQTGVTGVVPAKARRRKSK